MRPKATGTEAKVCDDIALRQEIGINKYGTTVAQNPLELRQWLLHAYEETLDKAVYLRRAIEEIDKITRSQSEKWLPIEKAPMDGTWFLAVNSKGHQAVIAWSEKAYDHRGMPRAGWVHPFISRQLHDLWNGVDGSFPIKWMPILPTGFNQ